MGKFIGIIVVAVVVSAVASSKFLAEIKLYTFVCMYVDVTVVKARFPFVPSFSKNGLQLLLS